jgi:hypothetical protein
MFKLLGGLLGKLFGGGAAAAAGGAAAGAATAAGGFSLGSTLASVVPGIIGSKLADRSARIERAQSIEDAKNKFLHLREAAELGGFNPETALLATGGGGFGAYASSAPPLASIELLTGAMRDFGQEVTGEAAQRRAFERHNLEVARLKLDEARTSLVVPRAPSAARGLGAGGFSLTPASTRSPATTAFVPPSFTGAKDLFSWLLQGDRETKEVPTSNIGGTIEIENPALGGKVHVLGDSGEPWGISEVIAAGAQAAPQVYFNHAYRFVGLPFEKHVWNPAIGAMRNFQPVPITRPQPKFVAPSTPSPSRQGFKSQHLKN